MGADVVPTSCDYLVIGGGAAGCVVASRLSEDERFSVVLVESGGENRGLLTRIPSTGFLASVDPRTNWNFETEPVQALGGRRLQWNQGHVLGGSSSINGMLYMRGHSREYDQWRQMGCIGWSFDDVLPFFKRAERNERGESRWHGASGPIGVRPSRLSLPICDAFLGAMADAGYPVVEDINTDVVDGFGRLDVNVAGGRRVSTANAYIDPVRHRPNLTVLSGARACRILFEGRRASAVELIMASGRQVIPVRGEVILSGGSVNSPQLLMLSGIGPATELAGFGIPVVADRPSVGRNLHNHPAFSLQYALSSPLSAYSYIHPLRALGAGLRYAATRGGPFAESYIATGGVLRTDPALDVPDIMVVMIPALTQRGGVGATLRELLPRRHGFVVAVSAGRPTSRGSIALRSPDPMAHPVIRPNYFSDPGDLDTLTAGVRILRAAMQGPRMRPHIEEDVQPGPIPNDPEAVAAAIREKGGTFWHAAGTCRMGGDPDSVVDPELRVRGVDGLRVADASIMPTPLNASTHAPTIMIGEKAAALIRASRSGAVRAA